MQYGIQKEAPARDAYTNNTGNVVKETGVWVNTKYPHLAASPDGIVPCTNGFGIVEIKCLKVLKEKNVSELISAANDGKQSKVLQRQCFSISNGKLDLKKQHAYYYQIQMQLLITEAEF